MKIAVDTNIFVYCHRKDSPFHNKALDAFDRLIEEGHDLQLPWPCIYEFISVVTHPKIFKNPTPLAIALNQIDSWLQIEGSRLISEEESVSWQRVRTILLHSQVRGSAVHDGKIVAICLDHRTDQLWSADRDFSRFPRIKVLNPLI